MTKIVVFRQTRKGANIADAEALLMAAGIPWAVDFGFSRYQLTVPTVADKVAARKALAAARMVTLTAKDREEATALAAAQERAHGSDSVTHVRPV